MTKIKNIIYCLEPHGGWFDKNQNSQNYDTGLCNRLLHWNVIHQINKEHNLNFKILVEKKYWPELILFNLPNTDYFEGKIEKNVEKIDSVLLDNLINKKKKLKNNNYYTDFGYLEYKNNKFPKINLRHTELYNFLKKTLQEFTGVHIRRGSGVSVPKHEDTVEIKGKEFIVKVDDTKRNLVKWKKSLNLISNDTTFTPDEYYFYHMDRALNKKFYISTDIPIQFLEPYFEKYGRENILTKQDFYDIFNQFLNKKNISFIYPYDKTVDNIIDIFSLMNCQYFIPAVNSSWSRFVKNYADISYPKTII